jgi:tetratricopeptide (TPR) repeat protein
MDMYFKSRWAAGVACLIAGCISAPGAIAAAETNDAAQRGEDPVIHSALVSALTGNLDELRSDFWTAKKREQTYGAAEIPLSDKIFYLYNCSEPDREKFLAGQEVLAAQSHNTEWKNRMLVTLLSDEVYQLNKLEHQNRFNKFTRVFNRASSSLSQLALLQPQAAMGLIWDGIYSIKTSKPTSVKERQMIYLCNEFLSKYPSAPEANEVASLRKQLSQRMLTDRKNQDMEDGTTAYNKGQFDVAEFHLERANVLDPADNKTSTLLQQARVMRVQTEQARELTLGVSGTESRFSKSDADALNLACRDLLTGKIQDLAAMESKSPALWDSMEVGVSALSERQGNHEDALARLQVLAQRTPTSAGGMSARKDLANPDYNLDESFQKALADMSAQQRKFIFTGKRTSEETVYQAGNAAIQSVGQSAMGVPVFFGMDAVVRAISEQFKTQVSIDDVVDAGARYLRKYPKSPRSQTIAAQLATLNKKAGDYKRSEEYLEQSHTGTPAELAKLKENQAVALYEQSKSADDLVQKKRILSELLKNYPDAKITRKSAQGDYAKLPPSVSGQSVSLPRKALLRDSRFLRYLGLSPQLADKSNGNGEFTEDGICINPDANNVEFMLKGDKTFRTAALPKQGRDYILTAARQLRSDYETAEGAHDKVFRQKLPIGMEGGVGSAGIDMAPKILPFPTSTEDKKRFDSD